MQQQDPSVKKRRRTKKQVSDKDEVKTPPKSIGNFRSLFLTKVNYCLSYIRKNDREGLSKVSNVLSLVVLSSACILWINYFFYLNSKEKAIAPNASSISVKGIFNYSGSPIYVSLIASGINIPLQDSNPEFRTRYAKPIVGDFSTDYAIAQLINGELSFVYTDRPLNDGEYGRANLRSISLEQVAVGIDGIVVFGNNDLNVGQLNLDQVRRIYAGEITNWHQIDPKIENLPITPIAVKNEKIEGIETTSSLTLQNLDINNIGISQPNQDGQNNTGMVLNQADGFQVIDCSISNIGRKGIGIGDTIGGTVSGVTVDGINLAAQHPQNHDAAGVKFYNTTDVAVKDSNFFNINAHAIWNDTSTGTTIENNTVQDVGSDFIAPGFNTGVGSINGIYEEKSANSKVNNNNVTANEGFLAFNATDFSTKTLSLGDNNFSSQELGTTDYYVNEQAENLIATTENPTEANFDLIAADYGV
jgi:ABC-type phosphate transport system substrate-binding protein